MNRKSTILLAFILLLLSSCSGDYLRYDDNGKIAKIEDPGDYTAIDKLLIHLGCHSKTDKIIAYSEYLIQENFQKVAFDKVLSTVETDSSYWFANYSIGFLYNQTEQYDNAMIYLEKAVEQFDGDEKEWADSNIGKENICRNLSYACVMMDCNRGYYDYNDKAINYGQQAILLNDDSNEKKTQAIYLVSQAFFKLKRYEEASFWIGQIPDKNLSEKFKEYYKRESEHNDSINQELLPDWPLFYYLKCSDHCHRTFSEFTDKFSEDTILQKKLYNRLIQEPQYPYLTYSEFHDLYFAYYDNYQDYLKPVKLDIKLMR